MPGLSKQDLYEEGPSIFVAKFRDGSGWIEFWDGTRAWPTTNWYSRARDARKAALKLSSKLCLLFIGEFAF